MATMNDIKRRLSSVSNTGKITKAMELVSAAKMRKAVDATLNSRTYAEYAEGILQALSNSKEIALLDDPLVTTRKNGKSLVVLVTSNRGLCGAFNSRVLKQAIAVIKKDPNHKLDWVVIGKKGGEALSRMKQNIIASFYDLPDKVSLSDVQPISDLIIKTYIEGEYSSLQAIYTDFKSVLTQTAKTRQLLPLDEVVLDEVVTSSGDSIDTPGEHADTSKVEGVDFIFEPNAEILLPIVIRKLVVTMMFQMVLESAASEHASRMMAMKSASEAAEEMMAELKLDFNKARQAAITQEISEISAGSASVS